MRNKIFFSANMRELKKRMLKRHVGPKQAADKTCAKRINSFLLLFKLCGLFANNVTASRVKRCSCPTYAIGVFWVGLFVSFICFLIGCFVILEQVNLRLSVHLAKHVIGFTSLSADVIAAYSSQNHFSKFFDRLDGYDHIAARMKKKRRDNLWIPWIVALLMIVICLLLVNAIIYTKLINDAFFILVSDIFMMIMLLCSFLEKFILLYLVLERFKHLNKNIAPNVSWDEERHEPNAIKILDVKIMHSMLYDAHQAFNDIYRNPLLLSFTSVMMYIVADLKVFRDESVLIASSLIAPSLTLILIMCIICHRTAEEANNIACTLNKSMTMLVSSGKTLTKIGILTYFLHNSVSFDAAGFFTIDLPLFHSVIATIATYFIILV